MTGYGYAPNQGFERFLREAEDQMSKAQAMKERLAEVVGRGESADGKISAEFKTDGGLTALDLNPRVLRLSSAELSQEIRAAVNAAAQDFQDKTGEVSREFFGGAETDPQKFFDPKAAMAEMEKLGNSFAGQMKDLLREVGAQQQRAKSAMEELRDPRQGC